MAQSHRKGAVGELEVRDLLQGWWTAVEPATKFNRAPLSGGWHAASDQQTAGDLLVTPGSRFPWSVEVKRRESWEPSRFVRGFASPAWAWWQQAIRDAATIGLTPMLWARRSGGNWIVVVPYAQAAAIPGAPAPRFHWNARALATTRGVDVAPVGYWASDFLGSFPGIWIPD
jgi:hypothetical protein